MTRKHAPWKILTNHLLRYRLALSQRGGKTARQVGCEGWHGRCRCFLLAQQFHWLFPAICFVVAALGGNSAELIDSTLAWPSVGCGMLFSLAAVRNFSPPKPAGFFACLMVVGSVGIACLVFASLLAVLSIALRQSYGRIAWRPVWLLLVVLAPVCFTYFSTKKLMYEQPPTNSD